MDMMSSDPILRKKKGLMEQFIHSQLPHITDTSKIEQLFADFVKDQKLSSLHDIAHTHALDSDRLNTILSRYSFSGQFPLRKEIADLFTQKLWLLERNKKIDEVQAAISYFLEIYEHNTDTDIM